MRGLSMSAEKRRMKILTWANRIGSEAMWKTVRVALSPRARFIANSIF